MDEVLDTYPDGSERLNQLNNLSEVPAQSSPPSDEVDPLLLFAAATSKNWEDPASVENVICLPSDPAIYGTVLGTVANPNLVYKEYCGTAEQMERAVVRQIANLAGYNPDLATGVFTQGGTFCNMYGYLFGLRKSLPESIHTGIEGSQDYRIINSQGGHYSNTTNLSVLGVDIKNKSIRIQLTSDNDMDMVDLEDQLTACFRLNCVVPTIMLTMGTTDTFGVDRVKPVYDLLNRLCDRFEIEVKPHIHVDAAVGWPLIFFLDYDFANNPLKINPTTLKGLQRNADRFQELRYADSFTVDFQKWGFVPYTSSLIMVKNSDDMKALANDPDNFSYFENDVQGKTHLQSTIECSRSAAGMFGAYSGLHYLGKEGYQTLIAH
ncbi:MAG: aspartate aminotransferase family protein, partial [Methylococcales bacterium]|nr:aspartate aminotransferase family protein [Methylococcales bacterium]